MWFPNVLGSFSRSTQKRKKLLLPCPEKFSRKGLCKELVSKMNTTFCCAVSTFPKFLRLGEACRILLVPLLRQIGLHNHNVQIEMFTFSVFRRTTIVIVILHTLGAFAPYATANALLAWTGSFELSHYKMRSGDLTPLSERLLPQEWPTCNGANGSANSVLASKLESEIIHLLDPFLDPPWLPNVPSRSKGLNYSPCKVKCLLFRDFTAPCFDGHFFKSDPLRHRSGRVKQ